MESELPLSEMMFPLHVQSPDSSTQKYECRDYQGQFDPHDTSPERMGIAPNPITTYLW